MPLDPEVGDGGGLGQPEGGDPPSRGPEQLLEHLNEGVGGSETEASVVEGRLNIKANWFPWVKELAACVNDAIQEDGSMKHQNRALITDGIKSR